MSNEETPVGIREGVRTGIVGALARDTELRGGRTARLLITAGALGTFAAVGMMLLLSGHPYAHHPPSHLVVFSAIWSGVLVVALAIAFLEVRTPSLPLARAAWVGLVGLGIAGVCGALCPDQHFLGWWSTTPGGRGVASVGGLPLSALCFGLVTALVFGTGAAALVLGGRGNTSVGPLLPAGLLVLLLAPGIALQSYGTSWTMCVFWLLGTAAGAYLGVALGIAARARRASA
jgi:hypothetical protein